MIEEAVLLSYNKLDNGRVVVVVWFKMLSIEKRPFGITFDDEEEEDDDDEEDVEEVEGDVGDVSDEDKEAERSMVLDADET